MIGKMNNQKDKGKDGMTSLRGKSAVVIGGSSGVGKALIPEGVRVTAVARGAGQAACARGERG
jgi:hypothetical protein